MKNDAPDGAGSNAWEFVSVATMFTIIGIFVMLFGVYYLVCGIIAAFPIVILAMKKEARENRARQALASPEEVIKEEK
jgi:hypothetical protein